VKKFTTFFIAYNKVKFYYLLSYNHLMDFKMRIQSKATLILAAFGMLTLSAEGVKPDGCKGSNLCSSYPVVDSCNLQFDAGLLYQQMRVSGAEIANAVTERNTDTIPVVSENYVNFTNTNIRFGFDVGAGLKLGAGYYLKNDGLLFLANFEWLRSTASFDGEFSPTIIYLPSGYQSVYATTDAHDIVRFQEVAASLDVDYFLLDVVLAKGSYFSGSFTFEPFSGIQSSWISYYTNKSFSNDANNINDEPNNSGGWLSHSQMWVYLTNVNFWGVGPEIGFNASYSMMGGWSIYSTMNAAVIFGQTALFNANGIVNTDSEPTFNHASDSDSVVCPTTRAILGLQYDKNSYCNKRHVKVRLGFDARYIFNQYPTVNYSQEYLYNIGVLMTSPPSIDTYTQARPNFEENMGFGMVGLIFDVALDF